MPLNVRAAVVHAPNEPFVIETLQLDGPGPGEVLIQVKSTGLCHSDLNAYEGKTPWAFPALLGHEAAGMVVECGPGVTQFKPGDRVIPFLIPFCGKCQYCHSPKTNLCVEGFNRLRPRESHFTLNGKPVSQLWGLGTFADYTVLPPDTIVKVRDDAPFDSIWPEIVDWYAGKKIDLDSLITHKLPLERIGEGFATMKSGESIRSVVIL